MSYEFKIRFDGSKGDVKYFTVKETYIVRVEGGKAECTCKGDTFRISGREQCQCKHAYEVLKRIGRMKRGK